ncbi:outer membrane protein assembly factor BamD [Marinomonas sp. C2222]|uniref:Outer membrane protein assembly factor BamD n=1 Tax=Marinomonas sargassi TaxID=2984494 RepID=A0ABT2YV22_9GAMM|nr:outer membrane protein assembly factor BamD [Marinomonas sargassi]MCV2403731.1 outer membrane protein assembly factor BamD [Marinomonas sargassi]
MGFHHRLLRISGIVSFSLLIAACSSTPEPREPDLPERTYYEQAQEALENGLPSTAIAHLKDLTARYPFGEYSTRAELDLIYAQIEANEHIAAHATAERFIKNNPEHHAIDYVYYMRALSTYYGSEGLFQSLFDLDPSERDSKELIKAFNELADLTARYPESEYAPDAKVRMHYLRELIARHEVHVARYYLKRKAPLSALRRSQEVIQNYPSSPSIEEALAVSIQSYNDLEQTELAQSNLAVLKQNFPQSEFVDESGHFIALELPSDADPGFLYWISFGLFD